MKASAYISIGSNLGNRVANCERALELLRATPGIEVQQVSPWYETDPVVDEGQPSEGIPAYVNGAAVLATTLTPHALHEALRDVEAAMGRPRKRPKGEPRAIDLDLLLYGEQIVSEPTLIIPHPELAKRLFVLVPLCAIAPQAIEPASGLPVIQLLAIALESGPHVETHPRRLRDLPPLEGAASSSGRTAKR